MNIFKIALFAGLGLATFTACDDGSGIDDTGFDTGMDDTGTPFNPNTEPLVQDAQWSCADDQWTFFVETDAWAGSVVMDIAEDAGSGTGEGQAWSESALEFTRGEFDDNGYWEEWDLTLDVVTTLDAHVSGETTLFGCGRNNGTTLTYKVEVYDDNNTRTDCAVWGHDPGYFIDQDTDCIELLVAE